MTYIKRSTLNFPYLTENVFIVCFSNRWLYFKSVGNIQKIRHTVSGGWLDLFLYLFTDEFTNLEIAPSYI